MRIPARSLRPFWGSFIVVAGCSPAVAPLTPPGMLVAVTSPTIDLPVGGVELMVANVTATGGFKGDVSFVIDGLPDGVRAETSASQTLNGVTSALLALAASTTAAPGDYLVTVRALSFGIADASTALTISISPPGSPVYTLEARPVAVAQGTSLQANTNIDRGALSKNLPITLTAEHLPAGITASLYPVTNYAALSTLTVAVGHDVPAGQYTITLRGKADGLKDRVANIPLTVLPGP